MSGTPDPSAQLLLAAVTQQLQTEGIPVRGVPAPAGIRQAPSDLARTAAVHKVVGPVADLARSQDLAGSEALAAYARRTTVRALARASRTAQLDATLVAGGVRPIFIKGVVLALQTTGAVNARGAGDIDLLVDFGEMGLAVSLLEAAGWQVRVGREMLSSSRPPSALHAVTLNRDGESVDLHHRLDHAPVVAQVPFAQLWDRSVEVAIGARRVATLAPADGAVFLAVNSAQDAWGQLLRVADFLRLFALVERGGASWSDVARQAIAWGAEHRFAVALAVARRLRPDLPRQDSLAESLAAGVWTRFWSGRGIWRTERFADKVRVDLFRLAATARPDYSIWWLQRLAARPFLDLTEGTVDPESAPDHGPAVTARPR